MARQSINANEFKKRLAAIVTYDAKGLTLPSKADTPDEIVADLEQVMKRLNSVISSVEKRFSQLNLGVDAKVIFDDDDEEGWVTTLRFGKDDKDWRLFVSHDFGQEDENAPYSWELLANAPRSTRANAIEAFPRLYAAMLTRAKREAMTIAEFVKKGEDFAASIGAK